MDFAFKNCKWVWWDAFIDGAHKLKIGHVAFSLFLFLFLFRRVHTSFFLNPVIVLVLIKKPYYYF